MSDNSPAGRPGLPKLALGTAVLAADRLLQLATRMQDQLGKAVTAGPPATDQAPPLAAFDPAHPEPSSPPSAAGATDRSAVTVAVGLAGQGVDFMRNTRDRVFDTARERGNRFSASVNTTVNAPIDRARDLMSNAGVRGQESITASREAAAQTLRGAMDDSIAWAETNLVPKVIDDLMPYLVSSVVPRLIDGAMPQIRTRVVPVVIDDLTADPRIREMITEQGHGMLNDAADELRDTSSSADDAVEASFRKLFHLTPDTDR